MCSCCRLIPRWLAIKVRVSPRFTRACWKDWKLPRAFCRPARLATACWSVAVGTIWSLCRATRRGRGRSREAVSARSVRTFEAAGIPILLGRDFGPRDDETAPKVAVVNETFARDFFGGAN